MCGIAGILSLEREPIDKALLKDMADVLSHRGPDDSGIFIDRRIGLAHKRLSIIDLSKAGHQPMHNEDGSLWIIYNGEVYNFKELRKQLEEQGHRFYSNTDTEVILHAYEEHGEKCLSMFNGMFAFAIWDSKNKKLFLARDRIGVKPLYYTIAGEKLLFASEIKAILQCDEFKREVNIEALNYYLTFRYVPGAGTLFKKIKRLLPGHYMLYENKKISIKQYWDVSFEAASGSEDFFEKKLLEELKKSVEYRLIADVPVGAYLSGGIDSSAIVALMSQLSEKVKTFSVGFGYKEDELKDAEFVASHFKTDHHEIMVKPDISGLLPKVIWHLDSPYEPISIVTYLLSQLASKKVKVVLAGEGADENFAGYMHHKNLLMSRHGKAIPKFIRKNIIANIIKPIPVSFLDKFFHYPSSLGEEGKNRLVDYISNMDDSIKSYMLFVANFTEKEKKSLYSEDFAKKLKDPATDEYVKGKFNQINNSFFNKILYYELKEWLPNSILMVSDRTSMANSIESRVPFLDYKIVEFAAKLPFSLKINKGVDKYILRKAMRGILPKRVIAKKKHAFFMPLESWLKGEFKEIVSQVLSESNVNKRGYYRYDYIQHLIKNYDKSQLVYGRQIMALLTTELWHRIYIDQEKPKELPMGKIVY